MANSPPPPPLKDNGTEMSFSEFTTQEVKLSGEDTIIAAYIGIMLNHLCPDIPETYAYEITGKLIGSVRAGVELKYEDVLQLSDIMAEMVRSIKGEGEESH